MPIYIHLGSNSVKIPNYIQHFLGPVLSSAYPTSKKDGFQRTFYKAGSAETLFETIIQKIEGLNLIINMMDQE
jgi:hypothetical protein